MSEVVRKDGMVDVLSAFLGNDAADNELSLLVNGCESSLVAIGF